MPKIKLKAKDQVIFDKITEAYEKTEIVQRQRELTAGRWDFVVFGPSEKNSRHKSGEIEHYHLNLYQKQHIIMIN